MSRDKLQITLRHITQRNMHVRTRLVAQTLQCSTCSPTPLTSRVVLGFASADASEVPCCEASQLL